MLPRDIFLITSILITTGTVVASYRSFNRRGAKSVFALSLTILITSLISLLHTRSLIQLTEIEKEALPLLGTMAAATLMFTFSLEATYRSHWINRYTIFLFLIILLFTQTLLWYPGIFVFLQLLTSLSGIMSIFTLPEKISLVYRYSLIAISVWLLGRAVFSRPRINKYQLLFLLMGPSLALLSLGGKLLGFEDHWLEDLFLVSTTLSAIGFTLGLFYLDSNAGLLMKKSNVVEKMRDGWIVLDLDNTIVDLNQTTAKLAGGSIKDLFGKSVTSILSDFPDLAQMLNGRQEFEMDKSIQVDGEYRYLNIRASLLQDDENKPIGHLVIWRDVTNRKRVEDARRQARDEMFVLLNAISNVASQTINLQEFLEDSIYQIIYPFQSQVAFVYILDESKNRKHDDIYNLEAHLGLPDTGLKILSRVTASSTLIEPLSKSKQPVLLEDLQDERIPAPIRAVGMSSLLATPFIVRVEDDEKLIGAFFLGRKDGPTFKQDEIVRLTILADQIARLIDSDRRRKLAITLSERKRLMRDIHDSLSQKLYGLVTQTEAAKAKVEAGADLDFNELLFQIGEQARQAVKELRLFLFQMQPVDLENEGLISVLHHRLTAVEGRANDIHVKFMADDSILVSPKKEVALYYIAQEALNNIMRHANAQSITVTLKQGYKYVTLEVKDDGCGFSREQLEQGGGLGLKNIRERVQQESGKLTISSKPGAGTLIKVTFDKDISGDSLEKK